SCKKQIFGKLLIDGGSAAQVFPPEVVRSGNRHLLPVEPMVLVKPGIFRRNHGMLKGRRDPRERNETILLSITGVLEEGLNTPLRLNGRRERIDPLQKNQAYDDEPVEDQSEAGCAPNQHPPDGTF